MKRNKIKKKKGFAVIIAIVVVVLLIIAIFYGSSAFVGDRQGATVAGGMIEDPPDTNNVADEVNANAGGTGLCNPTDIRKNPPHSNQKTVRVPIWKYTGMLSPISSTMSLTVNANCAATITAIFTQAYNNPAKPQISTSDTGCHANRTGKSWHPYGAACDVNWNENWCAPNCYHRSGYRVGNFWKPGNISPDNSFAAWVPGTDVRSIAVNSPIANAFKSNGWGRGFYSSGFDDVMHFSVDGH